jgi:hypothetical protein
MFREPLEHRARANRDIDVLFGHLSLRPIDTVGRRGRNQDMRILLHVHVDGQMITPHQTPGWVDQQCVGGSRVIKIDGRE